nr:retrovirus-related Pol polyprotein from transposon TNT 1-94 [Tanacetum cinerariifolium]
MLCTVLYPFTERYAQPYFFSCFDMTERYAQPYFFSCLIRQSANKKQEFVKMDDKKVKKKDDEKKRDVCKVKCYNCKKEGHFEKDYKNVKVKDYEYYKTKMLLAKKDKDEQVLLAKDQAWMKSISDSDQEINANMVFMAQIEKVLSYSKASSSSPDDKISEVSYYLSKSESESEYETLEYYDNTTTYGLFVNDNDDQEIFHECENFPKNIIESQIDHNESAIDHKDSEGQTNSLKPYVPTVILEKNIIDLEDEVVSLLEKENANLETIESLKSKGFESSENAIFETENQCENDCHVVEKECDNVENPKVITPGMFKLSVSQSVSLISITKTSCASNGVENLDTFSSVRRPNSNGVIWKKKVSSNTSNVDLSSVSHSKLNKDVKRYSRRDLLSCNNSHLGEISSAYICYDAMNVSGNSRLYDSFDENILFIFDDESVRISPVSKMPLRKKPHDSMNIVQICLWIIDSGCSKHMMGNHALLTNFVENFLGTVRFGNNDFAVIAGYGDVVIGSMTINKVFYVDGLGHNLFSVRHFWDKGLEVAFRKSTCFVRNEDGVDLLTGDCSSNLYTIALNEVASDSSTCLLAKASSSQSWLWHQRLLHLNFVTINNLVKNNVVQGLSKMKFEKDHLCSACEQGKIHRKHHTSKTAFASNKPFYLLHMDLCGPMHVENEASKVIISFIKKTQVNLQLQVQRVQTDNGTEFKNKTLAKFFDEIGKFKAKGNIRVFVGYSKESAAFRIYNKRTHKIQKWLLNNSV